MTSRGGMYDTEGQPFFFEPTLQSKRRTPKRYKKAPDELPDELKYAHLGPRVAAILANKDKEKLEGTSQEFDDGLGKKSLLPEINKKVSLIRKRFDSVLSSEENQIRQLLEEGVQNGPTLLLQLAKVLYLWEGLHPPLPRSLEHNLICNFKDFIGEVYVYPREWQIPSNKDEFLAKNLAKDLEQKEETRRNSVLSTTRSSNEEEIEKISKDLLNQSKDPDGRLSRTKSKMLSRTSTLADITENDETRRKDISRPVSRQNSEVPSRYASKKDLSGKGDLKPRTRLEKYKSGMNLDSRTGTVLNVKILSTSSKKIDAKKGFSGAGGRNLDSSMGGSIIDQKLMHGGAKDVGYWAVINFQLSSKLCDDLGWIIHPGGKNDPERETLLEWATQRLQQSIKQKKEQLQEEMEKGMDRPTVIRYYGDSRREQVEKYKGGGLSSYSNRNNPVYKGEKPSLQGLEDMLKGKPDKKIFMVVTPEGSTTIFYPSGRPAIVTCRLSSGTDGKTASFYTMVYDDAPQQNMLAIFTPWAHYCCYGPNGKVRLLTDKEGGTLADDQGIIQKRWQWPPLTQKLPVSVVVPLNGIITVRCLNINQVQLHFHCEKEHTKVNVGITNITEEVPSREDLGQLISGYDFSSQAAKEFSKPYRAKSTAKVKTKSVRGKKASQKAELEKLLSFTEPSENDPDADKTLSRLQNKVKNLVEEWLEHYRIHVGIASPMVQTIQDRPVHRSRDIKSAKPGGGVVIIERESTAVAKHKIPIRTPSAPASRYRERPVTASSTLSDRRPTLEHKESCVKFDDNLKEIEADNMSAVTRSVTLGVESLPGWRFPCCAIKRSAYSGTSRAQSAPQTQRTAVSQSTPDFSPSVGLCPVALRMLLLGHQRVVCRCSRHKVPFITDVELDEFIKKQAPEKQLIVIAVTNSLLTSEHPVEDLLESLHNEKNHNRSRPCMQSRNDPFRVFWYDLATASEFSDHSHPLLLRRHNVVMGMFLIYESGKLLFCDHIFNGYGNARKDFHKQLMSSRKAAASGKVLPQDFKFSPQKGRHGMRSAWGGEIGGLTVKTHHQGDGEPRRASDSSVSSGKSNDVPIDCHISSRRVMFKLRAQSAHY